MYEISPQTSAKATKKIGMIMLSKTSMFKDGILGMRLFDENNIESQSTNYIYKEDVAGMNSMVRLLRREYNDTGHALRI